MAFRSSMFMTLFKTQQKYFISSCRCSQGIGTKFSRASISAAKQFSLTKSVKKFEADVLCDVYRITDDIIQVLLTPNHRVTSIANYAFSARGKLLRPHLIILMAACANAHSPYICKTVPVTFQHRKLEDKVACSQHAIAVIAEMIHTASLIHDDLIDGAQMRRGLLATHRKFGNKNSVLIGNMILVKASELLAKLENPEVVNILSTVLDDLIRGEFMQLASDSDENQRFFLYLKKTYKKTASLIANSCKAVTLLTTADAMLVESAFEFGRHLGMAFQLLDDVLDFVGKESQLGKPAGGSDLQLGLATGPVLFAAQQFPELEQIMQNGFKTHEDRVKALTFVRESNGIGQTRMLAEFHFQEAQRQLGHFKESDARESLLKVAATTLQRNF